MSTRPDLAAIRAAHERIRPFICDAVRRGADVDYKHIKGPNRHLTIEDIHDLALFFLNRYSEENRRDTPELSPEVLKAARKTPPETIRTAPSLALHRLLTRPRRLRTANKRRSRMQPT